MNKTTPRPVSWAGLLCGAGKGKRTLIVKRRVGLDRTTGRNEGQDEGRARGRTRGRTRGARDKRRTAPSQAQGTWIVRSGRGGGLPVAGRGPARPARVAGHHRRGRTAVVDGGAAGVHPYRHPPHHPAALHPGCGARADPAPGQAVPGRTGRPAALGGVHAHRADHQQQGLLQSVSAMQHLRTTLRAALNLAVREGVLGANPGRHIEVTGYRKSHAQRRDRSATRPMRTGHHQADDGAENVHRPSSASVPRSVRP